MTDDLLLRLMTGLTSERARVWAPHLRSVLHHYGIACHPQNGSTRLRVMHFLAQIGHESIGLTALRENLHYTSAARIRQIWPSRFPTTASALPYVGNPKALAEKVYGSRMGNRPGTGDGFAFRGGGPVHTTGRDGYAALQKHFRTEWSMDVPLLADPDRIMDPRIGAIAAGSYWAEKGLSALADRNDLRGITVKVNGGTNGLEDRRARFNHGWRGVMATMTDLDLYSLIAPTPDPRSGSTPACPAP